MFGAEPEERLTQQDIEEFEEHVAVRHVKVLRDALIAGALLLLNVLLLVPFLAGHFLHSHWESVGKFLLTTALGLFLWFVSKAGAVWASYQAAKETRREFRDIE